MENNRRKERFDWIEFFSESWWWFLIIGFVIFGGIEGIIAAKQPPAPKERAVVVEDVSGIDDYKVKYLSDGAVQVVDLGDNSYIVGDTVLTER